MKKSNWIVYGVMIAASLVCLWLWYYLGYYLIDAPTDLIIAAVWWAVIAGSIYLVYRTEKSRKERVRTLYIGDRFFFNSEVGVKQYAGPEQLVAMMDKTLQDLKYDFTKHDLPSADKTPVRMLIHTNDHSGEDWKGEVVIAGEQDRRVFADKRELSAIINQARVQA